MSINKDNLTLHNIKRYLIAMKRKFQIWLFSRKAITSLFKDKDSLTDYFNASRHIREQFVWRIEMMKQSEQGKKCLEKGECICGCDVPDLQLADDACEGGCYPAMMNSIEWANFKLANHFMVDLERQIVIKYTQWK